MVGVRNQSREDRYLLAMRKIRKLLEDIEQNTRETRNAVEHIDATTGDMYNLMDEMQKDAIRRDNERATD
jgi:uncharacterized protein YukE